MKSSKWEVYIIQTISGKLYTGITNDLDKRFADHLNGKKGAKFFRFSSPKAILFREMHPSRSAATQRELSIKKMGRKEKLDLISGNIKDVNCE